MTKRKIELEEQAAKLMKTQESVYFAMSFISAWLDVNEEREHEDQASELYFDKIKESLSDLESLRIYLSKKIQHIKSKLRNNFIDNMLKEEKKNASKI